MRFTRGGAPCILAPVRLDLCLRDGTPVIARTLVPGDRSALAEAFRRASPETRYQRFWTKTGEVIGTRMLDKILDQDVDRHMTWAVLDPSREFAPVGGASWWRDDENPHEAEISAIVLDADQGRGIGTLLLALLWLSAMRAGVCGFVGHAAVGSGRSGRWMRACGGLGEWDGYKLSFRWDLHDLDQLPETLRAAELAGWLADLSPVVLGEGG